MKIALVIEHFDATRGGAEHFTVWLAKELAARGHEVHVVCHDVAPRVNKYRAATQRASHDADRSHQAGGAHAPEEVEHEGIHVHRIRGMRLNSGFGFRLFGRRARMWCARHKPEVVHSMTVAYAGGPRGIYHSHAGVYAAMREQAVAQRHTGAQATWKRLMLQLSGKQRALLALEKQAVSARGAGRVISLSRMMTEQLGKFYGVEAKRMVELPNPQMATERGMDARVNKERRDWFRGNYKLGARDKVAVFVGHDFRRKGLRYAIEAVARTGDWKLIVVGLGKAREYVELANGLGVGDEAAARKGVEPRVLFIGPTKEMDTIYAASDALILPTFYDSFGLVVLEAFAHGLPAVSTEFLGAGYLVKESGAGVIVGGPRDVEGMAEALEGLPAYGSVEQVAMAASARAASAGMLPGEYVDRLLGVYEEVREKK